MSFPHKRKAALAAVVHGVVGLIPHSQMEDFLGEMGF